MDKITFPNLNLEFNINPVAFEIGGKAIYWYGIIIMIRNNDIAYMGRTKAK